MTKMKQLLLITLLLLVQNAHAQYLKLDNGVIYSSFNNKEDVPILSEKKLISYSFLLGADYLEKDWFSLSSQVGYTKIGGKEMNAYLQEEYKTASERGSYIHINTTFRAHIKSHQSKIFAGIGPYVNVLTSAKNFESPLYNPYYSFKRTHIGSKAELGLTHDINKFRVGLIGTYMLNLSPSAVSEGTPLYINACSAMITTGYRIQ